jgi:flagellar motor protein MotB
VVEVRGYADQKSLEAANPESAPNRRISVVVRFLED